jgi:DNA-binding LacI/PurR family transcriptional regulator
MVKKKNNSITMRDIAKAANVSVMTVSQTLNPRKSPVRVSSATQEKILQIVRELDYQPNLAAKVLAGESSHMIGILIDSMAPAVTFRILSHIEREATKSGYGLMTAEAHDNVSRLCDSYHRLLRHGVDGIISLAHDYPGEEKGLQQCFANAGKTVFIDKPCFQSSSYVELDWSSGIIEAVNHLTEQNCQRIGIIRSYGDWRSLQGRLDGYRQATQKKQLQQFILLQQRSYETMEVLQSVAESVDFIIANRLDAIFAQNDFYAAAIINELQRRHIDVPGQVAVVGYDNEFFTDFFNPGISSIDWGIADQSIAAVKLLKQIIEGSVPCSAPIAKTRFVIRGSTKKITI